jgi:hypothetical protein
MAWLKIWFLFAAVMLVLLILTHAELQTLGLCFFAWCGGVVSTVMVQEQVKRRKATTGEEQDEHA